MEHLKTVHVLIEGKVQGVWYRAWTVEQAGHRGLAGWVRNLSDGRVEALFHGHAAQVDDMVAACHTGPATAHVTKVSAEASADHPGHGFHQRPTH